MSTEVSFFSRWDKSETTIRIGLSSVRPARQAMGPFAWLRLTDVYNRKSACRIAHDPIACRAGLLGPDSNAGRYALYPIKAPTHSYYSRIRAYTQRRQIVH